MFDIANPWKGFITIFVSCVLNMGMTMPALAVGWGKASKNAAKNATNKAADQIDKLFGREAEAVDLQIGAICSRLAHAGTSGAKKAAAIGKSFVEQVHPSPKVSRGFQPAVLESPTESSDDDLDDGLESIPSFGITAAPIKEALSLATTIHPQDSQNSSDNDFDAQDAVKMEQARVAAQRALVEAVDEQLDQVLKVRETDDAFVRRFIQSGAFVPQYAARDRLYFLRCREALKIHRTTRCSELYRKVFADLEVAYFTINFSGKRQQEIFEQRLQLRQRTDLTQEQKADILKELNADWTHLNLLRKKSLIDFGRNYAEYMFVRKFFEGRGQEIKEFMEAHIPGIAKPITRDAIETFFRTATREQEAAFVAFIDTKSRNWPTPPTAPWNETLSAWEAGNQLSQVLPDAERKNFLLEAIKGAKVSFPQSTQPKFNIIEKILVTNKVYEDTSGQIHERADGTTTEKHLKNFPDDHIRYIEKVIATFEVSPAFKGNLKSQVHLLLTRPSITDIKTLFENPKFHAIFEQADTERKLESEKNSKAALSMFRELYFQPIYNAIDQIPTLDSPKKEMFKNIIKMSLGLSKDLHFLWSYSGEIEALMSTSDDKQKPEAQLRFMFLMNAKYNVSKRVKDDFLVAAARSFEFRGHWVNLLRYVREMASSAQTEENKNEYAKLMEHMIEAQKQAEDISIMLQPSKLQIIHALGGAAISLSIALGTGYGAVKVLTFAKVLIKYVMHLGIALWDNGIHWVNSTYHLQYPLPEIAKFFQ